MADTYKFYWQPGCSSCLRAKEFLKQHGIAFDSINVREDEGAMDDLARLGAAPRLVDIEFLMQRELFRQRLAQRRIVVDEQHPPE